jgi:hypothetical protein
MAIPVTEALQAGRRERGLQKIAVKATATEQSPDGSGKGWICSESADPFPPEPRTKSVAELQLSEALSAAGGASHDGALALPIRL